MVIDLASNTVVAGSPIRIVTGGCVEVGLRDLC